MVRLPWILLATLTFMPGAGKAFELKPPVAQADTQSSAAAGITIEQLAQISCPSGIERFVPGLYYWCVGATALARGDDEHARSMMTVAASWGSKRAQVTLGVGYFKGDAGKLDRPLGLAWLRLAAERQDPGYTALWASALQQATPQERSQAQALFQEMLPVYGDARAARRAERRYRAERAALVRNEAFGARVCIAGLTSRTLVPMQPGDEQTQCLGSQPVGLVVKQVDQYADVALQGWMGHVEVGGVEQVPRPEP